VILTEVVVLAPVVKAVMLVMKVKTVTGRSKRYPKARLVVAQKPAKG
jgi:hypothetical protein